MNRQRRRLTVQSLETRKLMAGDLGNNEIVISQDDQVADGTSNTLMVGEVYTGTIVANAAGVSFDDFESRRDVYIGFSSAEATDAAMANMFFADGTAVQR